MTITPTVRLSCVESPTQTPGLLNFSISDALIQATKDTCEPYYYAPSGSKLSSFPMIWQQATILPKDTVAQAKWKSISGSIPTNISIKSQPGVAASPLLYPSDDPDCCAYLEALPT